ncbi:MAG: hypothetical protein ABW079_12245 [Sedimenticola sp.]
MNNNTKTAADSHPAEDKLVKLEQGKGNFTPAVDLNSKLTRIEIDLTGLTRRLESTDTRLMNLHFEMKSQEKVAERIDETHAELQELQVAYQELIRQSVKLARKSDELSAQFLSQNEQIADQHEELSQLERRTGALESKTSLLSESLESRVKGLNATLQSMESRFSEEIAASAQASEARDRELAGRIDRVANTTASAVSALESKINTKTDELGAGLRQANQDITTLFGSANDLATHTGDLQQQVGVLDVRTGTLEERADELEEQSERQQSAISTLFGNARRHLQWGAASLVLLLLLIGATAYHQADSLQQTAESDQQIKAELVSQNQAVQQNSRELADIGNRATELQASQQQLKLELDSALQAEQEKLKLALDSAVEAQKAELAKLQEQIETVEEKSDSANGRLSAMAPHRQFGTDSIIHGTTWLAKQDPERYVVRLISANDKEKLYQTAQRWGRYLKEDLAFYETSDAGQRKFVLVYGAFSDAASARKAAQRLPTIDPWQRKQVERMISIQGKI